MPATLCANCEERIVPPWLCMWLLSHGTRQESETGQVPASHVEECRPRTGLIIVNYSVVLWYILMFLMYFTIFYRCGLVWFAEWSINEFMPFKSDKFSNEWSLIGESFCKYCNYTSIDPKQQQTMFPRPSCAIKNSLVAPFLRKETEEKKEDKPRTPSLEPEGTRRNQKIMMEHTPFPERGKKRTIGRQAPEP